MTASASPFGKFAEIGAIVAALLVIAAWLASIVGVFPKDETLTTIALSAIMLLLGQRATTNGAAKIAAAANLRLDAIGAPSADIASARIGTNMNNGGTTNG